MTEQTTDANQQRASERNQQLARRVRRWSRTRLAVMFLFVIVGGVVAVATGSLLATFPFFAMGVLFLILFLDANEQVREIRRRKWRTLRPTLRGASPAGAATSSQAGVEGHRPETGA
jgi:hypothetical protein